MREITASPRVTIPLGKQGENAAVLVKFPIAGWEELYGHGSFEVMNVRPGESVPYPCTIEVDDDYVLWTVQSADVALVGHGICELTYVVSGTIAKSVIYGTCVSESIEGAGTVPAPYESRIQDLIIAATGITTEANRASDAATRAEEAQRKAEASEGNAKDSEDAAKRSEDSAAEHDENAEAWAVGQRNGVDVPQDDVTYNNSAKHYAELASQGAEKSGYVFFDVNDEDGCMYITTVGHIGEDITFEVDEEQGILEVIYT